ncbi:MAG: HAAS signaling domain-containing protein [Planctomycetota bacterium]|jgi:hypothetical protein
MTSEKKMWKNAKDDYLRKVEKALSYVKNHRKKEVLDEVSSHLDKRLAELDPDNQTWENIQKIITEMGPPSDYAELLDPNAAFSKKINTKKAVLVIASILLILLSATVTSVIIFSKKPYRWYSNTNIIVTRPMVGDFTLEMSKDKVLKSLGKPKAIFYGQERYTLDDLPKMYYMHFGDISFQFIDDKANEITVHSSVYKFINGLGVGDSEQKIKKAFGNNLQLRETKLKDFLIYKDEDIVFEIHKDTRKVMEISICSR